MLTVTYAIYTIHIYVIATKTAFSIERLLAKKSKHLTTESLWSK